MLNSIPFASFLNYSPRGLSTTSKQSKTLGLNIKSDARLGDGRPYIDAVVAMLDSPGRRTFFADFLGPNVVLVPVPRSAPLPPTSGPVLWVPRRICEALVGNGFGADVSRCLERVAAVSKSASAAPGARPSLQDHIASMRVTAGLALERITLVDDVVTKGTTLLASAILLRGAYPNAQLRAFALVRTCGFVTNVEKVIEPTVGAIERDAWGGVDRKP